MTTPRTGKPRTQPELAALNNAVWCDTVCRAHGVPGHFGHGLWSVHRAPPAYHANLVTIDAADAARKAALHEISALRALPMAPRWTVKDSHAALDLAPHGFEPLFDARWIWRDAQPSAVPAGTGRRWARVHDAAELARWEHAWSSGGADLALAGRPPQFPATLLADPDVAFFAGYEHDHIVAGGIANRSGPVAGLSNVFGVVGEIEDADAAPGLWAALVALAQSAFPDLPLVGYERGNDLVAAQAAGFTPTGPLRVWVRHD